MNLDGKTVLISGASSGMGEELVKQLAKKKTRLALFARRENKLKEIKEKIKNNDVECIYKKCDVTNKEDVKKAVEFTYKHFEKIDVAILNAGVLLDTEVDAFDGENIRKSMEVNFFGNVYFIENILPLMKNQKSGIIAVTSTLPDRRGLIGAGAYGASKAAISWLVESLRPEAKQKHNINFITIKPGQIKTPMTEDFASKYAIKADRAAEIIIKGVEKEKKVIQFPFIPTLLTRMTDMIPEPVYDKLI